MVELVLYRTSSRTLSHKSCFTFSEQSLREQLFGEALGYPSARLLPWGITRSLLHCINDPSFVKRS